MFCLVRCLHLPFSHECPWGIDPSLNLHMDDWRLLIKPQFLHGCLQVAKDPLAWHHVFVKLKESGSGDWPRNYCNSSRAVKLRTSLEKDTIFRWYFSERRHFEFFGCEATHWTKTKGCRLLLVGPHKRGFLVIQILENNVDCVFCTT